MVGGGPADIAAAIRASDLGKRVALIDGGPLGGAGIFDGALSSKTFWHLAMDYARAARSERAVTVGDEAEIVLEAALLLLGRSLIKPDAMPGLCTIVEG